MHHRAKPCEHFVVRTRERHPFAVAGFVVAVRDGTVRDWPQPGAHIAGLGVHGRQIVDHPENAFVERHVDLLACACPIAPDDRQQRAQRRVDPRDVIGQCRGARDGRFAIGVAGQPGKAAEPVRDPGVAGAVLIGAFLAIGRDADHDKVRLKRAQRFKAQAPAIECAGAKIFGDDVGLRHQFAGDVRAFRRAQIQRDRSLVARFAQPVEARSGARAQAERAQRIPAPRHLDLDHLGAELPEDRSAIGRGDHRRQVKHPKPFERSFAFVHGIASCRFALSLPAR